MTENDIAGEYLSPHEFAEMVGVSRQTLKNWRRTGAGPPFVKAVKTIRYRRNDVDAWLQASTVRPGMAG